ncbi:aminotransferase class III-fold pyridoxal phosphate-dependent enzyme, partial [Acinetobacter baumannii]
MVHQVGYAHPIVVSAIKKQVDELCFSPRRYTNSRAVELAQKLAEITPGHLSKVLFAPGGSAA